METIKERPVSMNTVSVGGILDDIKTQIRRVINPQPISVKECVKLTGSTYSFFKGYNEKGWSIAGPCGVVLEKSGITNNGMYTWKSPYGKIGDHLWVKETMWRNGGYVASDKPHFKNEGKIPSIFMFRKYSRILLEITHLRIEQIQDISDNDILAEGVKIRMKDGIVLIDLASDITGLLPKRDFHSAAYSTSEILRAFMGQLWNSINAKPKPVMSGKKIVSYISYPWDEIRETRDHRGLKWIVYGNPHVWAVTFKVLKKEVK